MNTSFTRTLLLVGSAAGVVAVLAAASRSSATADRIQFVFTSDAHYGLTRRGFRGHDAADATEVNRALVQAINHLPVLAYPDDGGVQAGERIGGLDFVVEGGDVANREEQSDETQVQPAAESWAQFVRDYVNGLHTLDGDGRPTRLYVVPGNHDASNAVGFYKPMAPAQDRSSLLSIYNLMVAPTRPLGAADFDYARDRVFLGTDLAGVHFQFLHIWPDSAMRARMDADLARVGPATPVVIFTHDQPDVEAKHFINPNGSHAVTASDRFENLLSDQFADGPSVDLPSTSEQGALEGFLVNHPNVTAYFHGNSNWHQAYDWNGPTHRARLHVFRVDSPMKGAVSASDERRLSFQVVTIDARRRTMTVRECLWNATGGDGVAWGESVTVTLEPRQSRAGRTT